MKLIKETYKNNRTRCNYICDKGHITEMHPACFSVKTKCKICFPTNSTYRNDERYRAFIYRAPIIHRNKYDYSLVSISEKATQKSIIVIICPSHGVFNQSIESHLGGHGCTRCKIQKTIDRTFVQKDVYLKELYAKQGNKTTCLEYNGKSKKGKFRCNIHNIEFEKLADVQLKKSKCPECIKEHRAKASKGFYTLSNVLKGKYSYSGYLYIVSLREVNTNKKYFKVGITVDYKNRFKQFKINHNFEIMDVKLFHLANLGKGVVTESLVKNKFYKYRYFPNKKFQGAYECYKSKHYNEIYDFISSRLYSCDIE